MNEETYFQIRRIGIRKTTKNGSKIEKTIINDQYVNFEVAAKKAEKFNIENEGLFEAVFQEEEDGRWRKIENFR